MKLQSSPSGKIIVRNRRNWSLGLVLLTTLAVGLGGLAIGRNSGEGAEDPDPQTVKQPSPDQPEAELVVFDERTENPFPNRIKAPSLDGGSEWLNTSGPIDLKDLRGKVVLLDFWTYCCINCMHILPDLKYLEQKFDKELVVIGVHSAKFENEQESENIRKAILRYEIEHPVINDDKMIIWQKFGARAWPTLVLIDPEGYYCGYISGEGNREVLEQILTKVIRFHRGKRTLDETPVKFDLERENVKPTPLKFPGKVLADETGNRLFIADSNHNRIVISTLDGQLLEIIGSGEIGAKDGAYNEASFDHPQGMVLVEDNLYVADTENHLIRVVNLETKTVSTLAGTGKQSKTFNLGGPLKTTALNSPWALYHRDGILYVAMAGPHQIWAYKLGTGTIGVFAGSGREDVLNGSLENSAFAQPSGLASDGNFLFVADSEGSAIRAVPFKADGQVVTIVGTSDLPRGASLFEFGDRDGIGDNARLQHPLGVAYKDGILYVADTYNDKIKRIDLKTRKITAWLGTGKSGIGLDPAEFYEPAGLSIAGNKLFIADTNNHRICVVDLETEKVSELKIAGLNPPELPKTETPEVTVSKDAVKVKPQSIQAGQELKFAITLKLPEEYKLNSLSPVTYTLTSEDGEQMIIPAEQLNARKVARGEESSVTITIPTAASEGKATLRLSLAYSYCRSGKGGLCKLQRTQWVIPVEASQASAPLSAVELASEAK